MKFFDNRFKSAKGLDQRLSGPGQTLSTLRPCYEFVGSSDMGFIFPLKNTFKTPFKFVCILHQSLIKSALHLNETIINKQCE